MNSLLPNLCERTWILESRMFATGFFVWWLVPIHNRTLDGKSNLNHFGYFIPSQDLGDARILGR
jgi:hypothetical protein